MAGKVQKAFQNLSEAARGDYGRAKEALILRFEPARRKELYNAELQMQAKVQMKNGRGTA